VGVEEHLQEAQRAVGVAGDDLGGAAHPRLQVGQLAGQQQAGVAAHVGQRGAQVVDGDAQKLLAAPGVGPLRLEVVEELEPPAAGQGPRPAQELLARVVPEQPAGSALPAAGGQLGGDGALVGAGHLRGVQAQPAVQRPAGGGHAPVGPPDEERLRGRLQGGEQQAFCFGGQGLGRSRRTESAVCRNVRTPPARGQQALDWTPP